VNNSNYNVSLEIEEGLIDIAMNSFSFAIQDSIYEVYPKMKFTLSDPSGNIIEHLFGVEGMKMTLSYGYESGDSIKCPFVFLYDDLKDTIKRDRISGAINYTLLHDYYSTQYQKSEGFKDRISNIVKKKIGSYNFTSSEVNDTGNQDTWYQPLKTDVEFIKKQLLPYAYSNNSNDSPFYFFIDCNNQVNFVYYDHMYNNVLKEDYLYGILKDSESLNNIIDLKKIRKGSNSTKKYRNVRIFEKSASEGIKDNNVTKKMNDYPKISKGKLPIIFDSELPTDFMILNEESETGEKENNKGMIINHFKPTMDLDSYIITLPFNPLVRSGKSMNIKILSSSDTTDSYSINYSDRYVITRSTHIWDGASSEGYTQAIVSRKFVNLVGSDNKLDLKIGG